MAQKANRRWRGGRCMPGVQGQLEVRIPELPACAYEPRFCPDPLGRRWCSLPVAPVHRSGWRVGWGGCKSRGDGGPPCPAGAIGADIRHCSVIEHPLFIIPRYDITNTFHYSEDWTQASLSTDRACLAPPGLPCAHPLPSTGVHGPCGSGCGAGARDVGTHLHADARGRPPGGLCRRHARRALCRLLPTGIGAVSHPVSCGLTTVWRRSSLLSSPL